MKNPSRKFIELIHATSSKWANWDPPNPIKVGDYGTIDRETGQFQKDGNVYEDETTAHLADNHKPLMGAPEDILIISSAGVTHRELSAGAGFEAAGLADASIKGRWEFGNRRGALLIISRPHSSYIPPKVVLKQLVNIPELKNKSLVTEVILCPAYNLYLSTASKEAIDVALVARAPTPSGATVGGEIGANWLTQNMGGLCRYACDPNGSYSYTPLYMLKKIRKKGLLRRESPVPDPEDDDLWVDVQEPWDPLDDDGEEEPFDDSISD